MRDRDAFGSALQTLRQRLRNGVYAPGAPLVIIELAHELHISATPMREALARLAGEGLIEDRRGWGFCVWQLGREAYEELYRLHSLYVQLALSAERPVRSRQMAERFDQLAAETTASAPEAQRSATEAVFAQVVEAGCQAGGISAHRSLKDRLAPLRLAEAHVFADAEDELRRLAATLDSREVGEPARALTRYHERRLEAIGMLIATLASGDLLQPPSITRI